MGGFEVDAALIEAARVRPHQGGGAATTGLPSSWRGTASSAAAAAHAEWNAGARDLRTAVLAMRDAVGAAHDNFYQAVRANRTGWCG